MRKNQLLVAFMALAVALTGVIFSLGAQPTSAAAPNRASQYFAQTGQTVKGRFLEYWQANGGLAQQGYPISAEMQEKSDTDGKTYTVQYFERATFELHAENKAPNDVLLAQLGTFQMKQRYAQGAPGQKANTDNARTFAQTGKQLGGAFRRYWESHGGLTQQGYPISDEFVERSDLDGKTYTVQYFERAVFEHHPENLGKPSEVLLSQVGRFRYDGKYNRAAMQPTPAASGYRSNLPDRGVAPDISSPTWINTPDGKPITMNSLRGKVVVVDFWTFGCYNCRNANPGMVKLYADFKDNGLEIIAPHAPEFDYERNLDNVKQAVKDWGITWPVPTDNDYTNWRAYKNCCWPAQYVVDKQGHIRAIYLGEGQDVPIRNAVIDLMKE